MIHVFSSMSPASAAEIFITNALQPKCVGNQNVIIKVICVGDQQQ